MIIVVNSAVHIGFSVKFVMLILQLLTEFYGNQPQPEKNTFIWIWRFYLVSGLDSEMPDQADGGDA